MITYLLSTQVLWLLNLKYRSAATNKSWYIQTTMIHTDNSNKMTGNCQLYLQFSVKQTLRKLGFTSFWHTQYLCMLQTTFEQTAKFFRFRFSSQSVQAKIFGSSMNLNPFAKKKWIKEDFKWRFPIQSSASDKSNNYTNNWLLLYQFCNLIVCSKSDKMGNGAVSER